MGGDIEPAQDRELLVPREKGADEVLKQCFVMTERRFQVARRLVKNKPWDYFMLVEMGPDRLHHVFWHTENNGT